MSKGVFSQMSGAFVRQIGREAAHSTYKNATSQQGGCMGFFFRIAFKLYAPSDSDQPVLLRIYKPLGMVCLAICTLFPFLSIVTFVKGLKRLLSGKVTYLSIDKDSAFELLKIPASQCPPKDAKRYKRQAAAYIVLAVLSIAFKLYGLVWYGERQTAQNLALQQQTVEMTHWNTYTVVHRDDFTEQESTRTFDYVFASENNVIATDYILIREKQLSLFTTGIAYIASYENIDFKIYKDGDFQLIAGDFKSNLKQESDKLQLTLLEKDYTFNYHYAFTGDLLRQLQTADSVLLRKKDHIYKFNLQ